jgi:hypothetical protein
VITTALVVLFAALALWGSLSRAAMARSHRDVTAFGVWWGISLVIVALALSGVFARGVWASMYDSTIGLMFGGRDHQGALG